MKKLKNISRQELTVNLVVPSMPTRTVTLNPGTVLDISDDEAECQEVLKYKRRKRVRVLAADKPAKKLHFAPPLKRKKKAYKKPTAEKAEKAEKAGKSKKAKPKVKAAAVKTEPAPVDDKSDGKGDDNAKADKE